MLMAIMSELLLGLDAPRGQCGGLNAPMEVRLLPARPGSWSTMQCHAGRGGSRRDMQKIVARTRHRRARHMKILNRRNLYDELEEEEDTERDLHALKNIPDDVANAAPGVSETEGNGFTNKKQLMHSEESEETHSLSSRAEIDKANPQITAFKFSMSNKQADSFVGVTESELEVPLNGGAVSESTLDSDAPLVVKGSAPLVLKGSAPLVEKSSEPKPEPQQEQEESLYSDLKVLVAGASGRTGRLIVEKLVSKGVNVRALVRDVRKADQYKELRNVKVVEGDLYKYETIKKGLDDSNVVICAVGSQAFPFDILNTYRGEYEAVLNLISAAKNQGKVKKFIFVTSLGVSFFQLVPILWWKRQAELFLQRSGLDYTIIRPGGLRENGPKDESIVMRPADALFFGGISRKKVAEVCVEAMVAPEASEKIVEIISGGERKKTIRELFSGIS